MDPGDRLAEWDDLAALPESERAEVVGGRITSLPPPLPEHGRAQGALGGFIGRPFDYDDGRGGPGGWWILFEVEVRLAPHEIVRPDAVGWRRARLTNPSGRRPIDVVPDWVCEILSPSNEPHDRVYKADLYARSGVAFYWIADPSERMLEAFRLDGESWVRLGGWDAGKTARIPPFEAVELEIAALFLPRPA